MSEEEIIKYIGTVKFVKFKSIQWFDRFLKRLGFVRAKDTMMFNARFYGTVFVDIDSQATLQNCSFFPYIDYFTDIQSLKNHMKDCRVKLKELSRKPKKVFEHQEILDDIWEQRKEIKK